MLLAVGLSDWLRRVFSSETSSGSAEDSAALPEEYATPSPETGLVPETPGLAGLESAEAERAQEAELKPPPDPAP